jgi:hypothetical protein
MPPFTLPVASYVFAFHSPSDQRPGPAVIEVHSAEGRVYTLWFSKASPLPPNGDSVAYFPYDLLPVMASTFREEKPVFLYIDEDTHSVIVYTGDEPFGEGPIDNT